MAGFLDDIDSRAVALAYAWAADPRLWLGQGNAPLEVVLADVKGEPSRDELRRAWRERRSGRPSPLLLIARRGERAAIVGPQSEETLAWDVDIGQVERICRSALSEPTQHGALRVLDATLPELGDDTRIAGLRNEGLFATHELRVGVPHRDDWDAAGERARSVRAKRGKDLLVALGFGIEPLAGPASMLTAPGGAHLGVAVFLDRAESPDIASERFGGVSPVLYGLKQADTKQVAFVIVDTGAALRLYAVEPGTGVAQRARTETFVELRFDLLRDKDAAYLWLLFSADALRRGGTVYGILTDSKRYAFDVATRLRERIYDRVVPKLAQAILAARKLRKHTPAQLELTYGMALRVLFRLLFVAYAEDLDLLPFKTNDAYRHRALKTKAQELAAAKGKGGSSSLWPEVAAIFRAVDLGNQVWGIPAYNGGLFAADHDDAARALAELQLPEEPFVEAFEAMMLDTTDEGGLGPVDFRALGVREFGTIYEGLLENQLSVAEVPLTIRERRERGRIRKVYAPADKGDTVIVAAGATYLGTLSGERKFLGSYYTKRFVVDHLLDHGLEPALKEHVERLGALDDVEAARAFFDFRVADLAMGSGHFLVAAVDRVERALSNALAARPLPGVLGELERLRTRAREALGAHVPIEDLDDGRLLRRQVARRCIYGVDRNHEAVELARLSLWIHTFVPGLPLSVLDHNIVQGDSLVGLGTIEEALDLIAGEENGAPLMRRAYDAMIAEACKPIERLARLSEADAAEIREARKALAEARKAVEPAEALFDIVAASRVAPELQAKIAEAERAFENDPSKLVGSASHKKALAALHPLKPFHFPLAFPEVFRRAKRPGFDVIVGNPPWEEATLERDDFWSRWAPGFQGMPQHQRETLLKKWEGEYPERVALFNEEVERSAALRKVLTAGAFPGMDTGDPDTYKAFAWRFWHLLAREGGHIGVVLPRSALSSKGSVAWRTELLARGRPDDVTLLVNRGGWVFDDVHQQYTVALFSLVSARDTKVIPLRGPFSNEAAFKLGASGPVAAIPLAELRAASEDLTFPLLPTPESIDIWLQLRKAPRLDRNVPSEWRARPATELHATNEKIDPTTKDRSRPTKLMHFVESCPDGYWPVFKGESFDIWESDRGGYYAWADPERLTEYLQAKRLRARQTDSPMAEMSAAWKKDPKTLPCLHPRVAFRDVTRATDTRTVRAALIPPKVVVTNKGPFFLFARGDERDQAFLLGVLSAIPLDWYARRYVEIGLNFHILNALPIPRPKREDERWQRVVAISGRLAAQDRRFASWAKKVGVECGKVADDEKADLVAELDAVVSHLYGLDAKQVAHVFETFHEGWDYQSRLDAVLAHHTTWAKR